MPACLPFCDLPAIRMIAPHGCMHEWMHGWMDNGESAHTSNTQTPTTTSVRSLVGWLVLGWRVRMIVVVVVVVTDEYAVEWAVLLLLWLPHPQTCSVTHP